MKLALTLLVRNEVGIVEDTIRYHLSKGVDFVVATDNRSVDGTGELLKKLRKEVPLVVLHEDGDDHKQEAWITRMVKLARDKYGADWVFNVDADEFIVSPRGDFKAHSFWGIDKVNLPRINYLPRRGELARAGYRRVQNSLKVIKPYIGPRPADCRDHSRLLHAEVKKVAVKASAFVKMGRGGHEADLIANRVSEEGFWMAHFALGSYEEFELKVKLGGAAMQRRIMEGRGWNGAVYLNTWFRMYEEGTLREEYERMVPRWEQIKDLLQEGRVVLDGNPDWFQPANDIDDEPSDLYRAEFFDRGTKVVGERAAVVRAIVETFNPESVIDLGCGGAPLLGAMKRGSEDLVVRGVEGSRFGVERAAVEFGREGVVVKGDLRRSGFWGRFDLVMCVEVAEHLEEKYANTLVDNICRAAKGKVLFTAAPPGQGGLNHVNCQPGSFWVKKFKDRGFVELPEKREMFRENLLRISGRKPDDRWLGVWYYRNAMVFRSPEY